MTHAELCVHFESRLLPGMTWRDLVRAWVGRRASDLECDFAWFHIAKWPYVRPEVAEENLAAWCREDPHPPIDRLRRARDQEARA